jgi:hypothetical protein
VKTVFFCDISTNIYIIFVYCYTLRSLTTKVYQRVGDIFRDRFGAYAGWAHSLLFAAELPMFSKLLPPNVLIYICICVCIISNFSYAFFVTLSSSLQKLFFIEIKICCMKKKKRINKHTSIHHCFCMNSL